MEQTGRVKAVRRAPVNSPQPIKYDPPVPPAYVQPSSQKFYGAAATTPLSVLAMWGLQALGLNMPPEAQVALGGLVASVAAWAIRN